MPLTPTQKFKQALALLPATAKSLVKMAVESRRHTVSVAPEAAAGRPLIIMGNGPSLAADIAERGEVLAHGPSMAVNFAANAPEFGRLRPAYYLLADPHFADGTRSSDANVVRLFERINAVSGWKMTLFLPARWDVKRLGITNPNVTIERYNPVGVEGWTWLENRAYKSGLGMPRPRNVLIPAIMVGMLMGYKRIYIAGADHTWLKTLSVTDDNLVVSVQPHFYADNTSERERVTAVYRDVRLHDILMSFHLAFRSYHAIERYARSRGVEIFNSTPGSYIDAFERRPLPQTAEL